MSYPYYTREVGEITLSDGDREPGQVDHPSGYLPDIGLVDAVNVALVLNRPLLLTGPPGTGKTQLARSVAWQLARRKLLGITSDELEKFETKSTSTARDLFYSFDTLRRFHAAQSGGSTNNEDYITYNALGRAIRRALAPEPARTVVLIDEIDKAPRDFPNDLLNEIEQMFFRIPELGNAEVGGASLKDSLRPIVIITSNSERNLPDPFLRRCIYYDIPFPKPEELHRILLARLPRLIGGGDTLAEDARNLFYNLREGNVGRRRISPAELIQWLTFLLAQGADPRRRLAAAGQLARQGLGALVKDPVDREPVAKALDEFLGPA